MTEAQQRFLKEIADRTTGGRVAELRLYPTVRVGPIESGVAIVAMDQPVDVTTRDNGLSFESVTSHESPVTSHELPVTGIETAATSHESRVTSHDSRLSIHTAHFRHTVKGPDRGKWEFSMVHDADAPIETVESVVRGVARRAGEDGEPELLSAEDFRDAITRPWWTATS
jgi:hypothetical protein